MALRRRGAPKAKAKKKWQIAQDDEDDLVADVDEVSPVGTESRVAREGLGGGGLSIDAIDIGARCR